MSRTPPPWLKPVVDYVPLVVFLVAYMAQGLMVATAALMAATAVALALSYALARRLPVVPVVTALVVGVFGGLTLWLHDETFIKLKPTVVYGILSAVLLGGLAMRRPLLKPLLGEALVLDDAGWRMLSLRFALFFLALALGNEVARRILTTDLWVLWKVPGCIGLSFVFILFQAPLIKRHRLEEEP